jgi:hypothetical protein
MYSAYGLNHLDVMLQKQSKPFLTFYCRASLGNISLASDLCVNWGISFLVEGNTCGRCNMQQMLQHSDAVQGIS